MVMGIELAEEVIIAGDVLGPTRDLPHMTLLSHHPTIYLLPLCILVFSLQRFSTAQQHAVQQPIRVYCILIVFLCVPLHDGSRHHTRVYGSGICRACEEPEEQMRLIGVSRFGSYSRRTLRASARRRGSKDTTN